MSVDHEQQEDLQDVMEQEKRRGKTRRPLDAEAKRKEEQLKAAFLKAIRARDERAFADLLRKVGYADGSPEFVRAWKMFHSL
jgi:hypothetical protein